MFTRLKYVSDRNHTVIAKLLLNHCLHRVGVRGRDLFYFRSTILCTYIAGRWRLKVTHGRQNLSVAMWSQILTAALLQDYVSKSCAAQ